jgi:DNA-binding MarR family transcriptional regulator
MAAARQFAPARAASPRRAAASCCDGGVDQEPEPLGKQEYEQLAAFRFAIRSYLRFSEDTVRDHGLSPQQYQLLLAIKGFPGRDWATVKELAQRLQLRHHSVVELVDRAQHQGLVARRAHPEDARAVRVVLTADGERALRLLAGLHRDELRRMGDALTPPPWPADARPGTGRPEG